MPSSRALRTVCAAVPSSTGVKRLPSGAVPRPRGPSVTAPKRRAAAIRENPPAAARGRAAGQSLGAWPRLQLAGGDTRRLELIDDGAAAVEGRLVESRPHAQPAGPLSPD